MSLSLTLPLIGIIFLIGLVAAIALSVPQTKAVDTKPITEKRTVYPEIALAKPIESAKALAKSSGGSCDLAYIRLKESTNNYQSHDGSGQHHGAYQYKDSTWNNYGGYPRASDAPPSVQDERAAKDLAAGKQSQWSVCN